jgi:general secretion pathway protein F
MAIFVYKALNEKGKQIKGIVDAESLRSARFKLKQQGIFPTQLEESKKRRPTGTISITSLKAARGISTSQLAIITRQFATLVGAGIPLVEALKALGDQIDQPSLKTVIVNITDRVNEGSTLAAAIREHPSIFPKLYSNMVASGESSGTLDSVLQRLADLLESQATLKRKILSAMTYPCLMLLLCFGVILLLLGYVVPQITKIFESKGAKLPLPTQIVIALSSFVQNYWWLVIAIFIGLVLSYRLYVKKDKGRWMVDYWTLKIPIIGQLKLKIAISRFSRNLGIMLASGIELLTALAITKNLLGSRPLEEAIERAIEGVREGRSLAVELKKSQLFPRLLTHMTAIGEKTGQLEPMLQRAADSYEREVDAVISSFTSILEPVLIIFLAGIVGAILAAVMLPMLQMTSLVK